MIKRLTADHTNSTTTKTDVTDLNLPLLANTVYEFEYILHATANATTVGIQFEIDFSGTLTRLDAVATFWTAVTAFGTSSVIGATTVPQGFNPTSSQGNVPATQIIRGEISVGASGGTLTLRHGSETATLTTLLRSSYVVAAVVV